MQHSLPPIPHFFLEKPRNGWGTAFQNFWAGSIGCLRRSVQGEGFLMELLTLPKGPEKAGRAEKLLRVRIGRVGLRTKHAHACRHGTPIVDTELAIISWRRRAPFSSLSSSFRRALRFVWPWERPSCGRRASVSSVPACLQSWRCLPLGSSFAQISSGFPQIRRM
jgi:hypothetical protein